jgi:hypothetical protein
MRIARVLRIALVVVAGLGATIIAGLAGLLWLVIADPWFADDDVRQVMRPSGPFTNQVVDDVRADGTNFPRRHAAGRRHGSAHAQRFCVHSGSARSRGFASGRFLLSRARRNS